jgi:hypothetical protein
MSPQNSTMKPNERQGAEGKLYDRKTQKLTAVEIGGVRFERKEK